MANLKSLAKDTAIYGLSSIVGRFLNYLLFPLHVSVMSVESGGYGVVTNIYAFTAFILVLLIFGMETGFFRFANKKDEDPSTVYSTILTFVGGLSLCFLVLCLAFITPISSLLGYAKNPEFIAIMAIVVTFDAFLSIPYASLRYQQRPLRFAIIKCSYILLNILLNIFFLVACPWLSIHFPSLVDWFYRPDYAVGYVFIANLICVFFQLLLLSPQLRGFRYCFDRVLLRRLLTYTAPLVVLGVVGILNQTIDRMIFPFMFDDKEAASVELGIYGAATKIAMIMAMFTQAFRYAYEPFVFAKSKDDDNRSTYAASMKYFIIFALLAFLAVMFYLDILRYIIAPGYWPGLRAVPIVMTAEIFMGIYFNLSFWYKLIDETRWGAYFSIVGCVIIVTLNVVFIPVYGYMACAWAGLIGYAAIMILSYAVGQKKYPIAYDLKGIGLYVMLAGVLYGAYLLVVPESMVLRILYRTFLLCLFIAYVIKKDLPLRAIPIINRFFK